MAKQIKLDNIISTRPDITINYKPSGSYIIRDGKLVPNLQDDAMNKRELEKLEKEMPKQNSEEENGENKKSNSNKD